MITGGGCDVKNIIICKLCGDEVKVPKGWHIYECINGGQCHSFGIRATDNPPIKENSALFL